MTNNEETIEQILDADSLSAVERFELPNVSDAIQQPKRIQKGPLTASQIEEIYQQAKSEGFNEGKQEGLKAGQTEAQEKLAQLGNLISAFQKPLRDLDSQVEEQLLELLISSTKCLLKHELTIAPEKILTIIQGAILAGVFLIALINLMVDISYTFLDPRIKI